MPENATHASDPKKGRPQKGPTCNVNSSFNYSVGAVSVAAGTALIYMAWKYLA